MQLIDSKTVLCIPGRNRKCAIGFPYIKEICKDLVLSPIPCLPAYFAGVCNYKGTIVPIAYLEEPTHPAEGAGQKNIIVILQYQKYSLGILTDQEPFLTELTPENRIKGPEKPETGLWAEKEYYMCRGGLYFLLDIGKTVKNIIGG
ncbi:chemotaxis protein CheW [Enterocloster aldenensis]|uniref:chemotaxis protein CheW n=1 Tax=Enterocloster aldenensis TaxID=358742 RepID=UPI000E4687EA|nr:chemotaxis protein CheW [Enterocloster aldenensis]